MVAVAVLAWVESAAGWNGTPQAAVAAGGLWIAGWRLRRLRGAWLVALVALLSFASGAAAAQRVGRTVHAELPSGKVVLVAVAETDGPRTAGVIRPVYIEAGGEWVRWHGPRLGVSPAPEWMAAGDRVLAAGKIRRDPGRVAGKPTAGWLRTSQLTAAGPPADPVQRLANVLRSRILGGIPPGPGGGALLAGLLVGDTSRLGAADLEALRRSGLSHYVAVSGSNVAIFLTLLWLLAGPLAWGPRRRAVVGLAGLAVFTLVTRAEPSVLRAAVMAALVLGGRLAGVAISGWSALGVAVTGLLLMSGDLNASVGFQLSVAATAGVMAGSGLWRGSRWLTALGAGLGAQVAVGPLLLIHFGMLPLASPIANLLAAAPVVGATAVGGLGAVLGVDVMVGLAGGMGGLVLAVARAGAALPGLQGSAAWTLLASTAAALSGRWRPVAAAVAAAVVVSSVWPAGPRSHPIAVFLDVGQGDAALLLGGAGEVILIDGGPDPAVLRRAFRRYGVDHVDLVIVSHLHADHIDGLEALGDLPVGEVWYSPHPDVDGVLRPTLDMLAAGGASTSSPPAGSTAELGGFRLEVLGPRRRYASPNDESLVVRVTAGRHRIVFTGDVEALAQNELGPIEGTILKVPHQGAATSDLQWLASVPWELAVISVGPNSYGHPDPEVVRLLTATAGRVVQTDEGDVVVALDR